MENMFNTPAESVTANINGGVTKANLKFFKMVILGIIAGFFIGLGAATSNLAVHNIANVGVARFFAGCIFPVGLMMIVIVGGELFTGNCMLIMDVMDKKITFVQMLRNLVTVYFSNLIGGILCALVVYYAGNFNYSSGLLGAYTIKVAVGKCTMNFGTALCSGILCNILVCVAILMANASKDLIGKIFAIWFPIMAFVTGGFEHCVANMYYIPAGILAAMNDNYVATAVETYGLTEDQIHTALSVPGMVSNLLPVTIGNIIGGMLCVGVVFYAVHKSKLFNPSK